MGKKIVIFSFLFTFLFGSITFAHSGRTDSSGGHNCSEKSQAKGLCSGYHYHNGGSSTSSSSSSSSNYSTDKNCSDFATYDEVVNYWNSKGYTATYDPENLDGWGNGQVDDGIPCEVPSGYDKTKINYSPEQVQYKKEQQDLNNGEKQGYTNGLTDGYKEASSNSDIFNGSYKYQEGYSIGYDKGYKEGKAKIDAEKIKASKEGYAQGKKQNKISIPEKYSTHQSLIKSFESGFNQAIEEKKNEFIDLGYKDGKKDTYSPPKTEEEIYVQSYHKGYEKGQNELKEKYVEEGYQAAFSLVQYKVPNLTNAKYKEWYKEGFSSNKEVEKIKDAGFALGQEGEDLVIPSDYKKGEIIYTHYYKLGYKEYEEEKAAKQKATSGTIGVAALAWLGRRIYVAKKMIG